MIDGDSSRSWEARGEHDGFRSKVGAREVTTCLDTRVGRAIPQGLRANRVCALAHAGTPLHGVPFIS